MPEETMTADAKAAEAKKTTEIADPLERAKANGYKEPEPLVHEDRVTALITRLEHGIKSNAPLALADLREIEDLLLPEEAKPALAVKRLNMPMFRAKGAVVNAMLITDAMAAMPPPGMTVDPATKAIMVETADGAKPAIVGDWIVRDSEGKLAVFKDGEFAVNYEAA
jgi:hypothetical protein